MLCHFPLLLNFLDVRVLGKKKPIVYYIVCGQGAQLEISAVEACRMEILVILSEYEEPVVGLQ